MATTRWAAKSEKSDTILRKLNEAVIATCFSGARGKPSRRCRRTRSPWPEPPAKVGSHGCRSRRSSGCTPPRTPSGQRRR
eukprot:2943906-Prymnesium_polylepis.1